METWEKYKFEDFHCEEHVAAMGRLTFGQLVN